MRLSLDRKILGSFILALAAFVIVALLSYRNTRRYVDSIGLVAHTNEVIAELEAMQSTMEEAETVSRGYIITGRPEFLGPYNRAVALSGDRLKHLRELTRDNPRQQQRLDSLETIISDKLSFLQQTLTSRSRQGFEAAQQLILMESGQQAMDRISGLLGQMEQEENGLLTTRITDRETSVRETTGTISILLILLLAILALMYVLIRRDLAGRRHAERELRSTHDLLDSIVENIPAMIFMKDARHLKFVRFNKAGEDLTGLSRAEMLGKGDHDFFPKEEADFFTAKDREVLERRTIVDIPEEPIATKHRGNRLLHTRKISLLDDRGEPQFLLGISVDITDRIAAEHRFQQLLEAAPDSMVIVDESGRIVLINSQAERLFGYTRSEMLGQPVEMLIPAALLSLHESHRKEYFGAPAARPMGSGLELFARRKDGSQVAVEISLSPLRTAEGNLVISSIRDVTSRKLIERQLRTLNNELEAFSYSVSHDLRAPLRSIDGFSHAILEDYASLLDERGKGYLDRVRAASQRMAQLIDDLLNLSRVSRAELRREPIDLSEMAHGIAEELRRSAPERDVRFEIPDGIRAEADARLIRVVMDNLLGNAWKYTSRKQRATIAFGQIADGNRPAYYVRDDGAGFDMHYADKLFGAFQRLHGSTEFPGTGIGLATVQRIIHRHGGRVWAEGTVDRGATFYFTLS